jgi:hypothetical protein
MPFQRNQIPHSPLYTLLPTILLPSGFMIINAFRSVSRHMDFYLSSLGESGVYRERELCEDLQVRSRPLAFRQVLISASSTHRRRCPRVITSITCSLRLPHIAHPPSFRNYRLHSSPNSLAYPLSPTITPKDYWLKFVFIMPLGANQWVYTRRFVTTGTLLPSTPAYCPPSIYPMLLGTKRQSGLSFRDCGHSPHLPHSF